MENDSKSEKVVEFLSITSTDNVELAERMLAGSDWDVNSALESFYACPPLNRGARRQAYSSASPSDGTGGVVWASGGGMGTGTAFQLTQGMRVVAKFLDEEWYNGTITMELSTTCMIIFDGYENELPGGYEIEKAHIRPLLLQQPPPHEFSLPSILLPQPTGTRTLSQNDLSLLQVPAQGHSSDLSAEPATQNEIDADMELTSDLDSTWEVPKHAKRRNTKRVPRSETRQESSKKFMSTFKMMPCEEEEAHDWRTCFGYHNDRDHRRNPFTISYDPNILCENIVEGCTDQNCRYAHNVLERMYHPALYRTSPCQERSCRRGKFCAFFHDPQEQRTPQEVLQETPEVTIHPTAGLSRNMSEFLDEDFGQLNVTQSGLYTDPGSWSQIDSSPAATDSSRELLPLAACHSRIIHKDEGLKFKLKNIAAKCEAMLQFVKAPSDEMPVETYVSGDKRSVDKTLRKVTGHLENLPQDKIEFDSRFLRYLQHDPEGKRELRELLNEANPPVEADFSCRGCVRIFGGERLGRERIRNKLTGCRDKILFTDRQLIAATTIESLHSEVRSLRKQLRSEQAAKIELQSNLDIIQAQLGEAGCERDEAMLRLSELLRQSSEGIEDVGFPPEWDLALVSEGKVHRINLDPSEEEYDFVLSRYMSSVGGACPVRKIERVQIKSHWESHRALKHIGNERWLFHGTHFDSLEAILHSHSGGFNRSFAGQNAAVYGNGNYFARDAKYSLSYAKTEKNGSAFMFLCHVWIGEFTHGKHGLKAPPFKNEATKRRYDSVSGGGGDDTDPEILVTFKDFQAYPSYIIEFARSRC